MNVKQYTQVIVTDSEVIERIMALSDKNLWGFKILGQMEPIKEPVFFDGFRCDLIENETDYIPSEFNKRLTEVEKIVPTKQVLILHEVKAGDGLFGLFAPSVVPIIKPVVEPEVVPEIGPIVEPLRIQPEPRKKQKSANIGEWIGLVLTICLAAIVGFFHLFFVAIMVDPAAVCVVKDEHGRYWWIEILWWPA